MRKVLKLLVMLLMLSISSMAQSIQGEWIKVSSVNANPEMHTNPNSFDVRNYNKLIFSGDSLHIFNNPYDRPTSLSFYTRDNELHYLEVVREFFFSGDTLYLKDLFTSDDVNFQPKKMGYVRIQPLNDPGKVPVIVLDTISLYEEYLSKSAGFGYIGQSTQYRMAVGNYNQQIPWFLAEHGEDFYVYLQRNIRFRIPRRHPSDTIVAEFSLLINSEGKVTEVEFPYCENEKLQRNLKRFLSTRMNRWHNPLQSNVKMVFPLVIRRKHGDDLLEVSRLNNIIKMADEKFNQQKYQEAVELYTKVLDIHSAYVDALYNRGMCFYYLRMSQEACADWNAVYNLGYNDTYELLQQNCSTPQPR